MENFLPEDIQIARQTVNDRIAYIRSDNSKQQNERSLLDYPWTLGLVQISHIITMISDSERYPCPTGHESQSCSTSRLRPSTKDDHLNV